MRFFERRNAGHARMPCAGQQRDRPVSSRGKARVSSWQTFRSPLYFTCFRAISDAAGEKYSAGCDGALTARVPAVECVRPRRRPEVAGHFFDPEKEKDKGIYDGRFTMDDFRNPKNAGGRRSGRGEPNSAAGDAAATVAIRTITAARHRSQPDGQKKARRGWAARLERDGTGAA